MADSYIWDYVKGAEDLFDELISLKGKNALYVDKYGRVLSLGKMRELCEGEKNFYNTKNNFDISSQGTLYYTNSLERVFPPLWRPVYNGDPRLRIFTVVKGGVNILGEILLPIPSTDEEIYSAMRKIGIENLEKSKIFHEGYSSQGWIKILDESEQEEVCTLVQE